MRSGATEQADTAAGSGPRPAVPAPAGAPRSPGAVSGRFLARATLLSAALSMAAAVLGLGRDQALAHLFGAGAETDAFLVAWTVPEMASTLLIEDGMAFVLVPAFSLALARRGRGTPGPDPVRALVAASLPRLCLALAGAAALLVLGAPLLVAFLAPGLSDPSLAVACTRLTATCVLSFGLAGYCSAALRAHRSYLAPGAIYIAYNAVIIATMVVLAARWGVRAAALGVALGGCAMALAQAPSLWRRLARRPGGSGVPQAAGADRDGGPGVTRAAGADRDGGRAFTVGLVCAVLLFAVGRQSQVLIERYFASGLPAGAISHLNYAQKVAQLPMSLAMMVCVVTFPVVARAIAEGDVRRARDRVERDLALMACLVLLGTSVVVACAPGIVQLLFQRGAFTAGDTAATAAVMRVYALGLLGHTLVGALVRSYFSTGRASWYPPAVMGIGVVATIGLSAWAVGPWGARGIAGANAAGITLTALLLLLGLGPQSVPVRIPRVAGALARPVAAAVGATAAGLAGAGLADGPAASTAAGCACASVVFLALAWLLNAAGVRSLPFPVPHSVRSPLTRKLRHGR
ncbi:murein biosynthesis protein MurJ [Streptomyces sp. FB2]|uniref:lipid II flippase MurJ n=1 Tax=Streptomyces sp. FB2 TaxID=2902454 RepID=UPI001F2DC344|nr:lipid II flippase MurJ [Streptomyces sp. FB2]MCF2536916.1 murein biosynthesis protein MurJ [Streptomyces sp. FB2]